MFNSDLINKNPKLIFNLNKGIIKILGQSTMTEPQDFYPSVINLVEEYCKNPHQTTKLIIDLKCYNSLSSRFLLKIIELISHIKYQKGREVKIEWHFDPDDKGIADDIKLFSKIVQFKIEAMCYQLA